MRCPRCSFDLVEEGPECPRCGVVFAKLRPGSAPGGASLHGAPAQPDGKGIGALGRILLAAAFGVGLILVWPEDESDTRPPPLDVARSSPESQRPRARTRPAPPEPRGYCTYEGTVRNHLTLDPIGGATLTIGDDSTETDESGRYRVEVATFVEECSFFVSFFHPDYDTRWVFAGEFLAYPVEERLGMYGGSLPSRSSTKAAIGQTVRGDLSVMPKWELFPPELAEAWQRYVAGG